MNASFAARAAFSFSGALFMFMSALPVHASHNTDTDSWSRYFEYGATTASRSRIRLPSAAQQAVDDLQDQSAQQSLPIPVLLGISVSNLTPNFRDPRDGGSRTHEGQDIMAPLDAYVVSPTDAVVMRTGTGGSAGTYVYTANPGGETFAYMHLNKIAPGIAPGMVLKAGDLIGYVGNTGNASGGAPHLHFEIRSNGQATDPYPRLTRTFTTAERMRAVEKALVSAQSPAQDAATLVNLYRSAFVSAQAEGMALPSAITDRIGTKLVSAPVAGNGAFTRDLTLGSRGDDVTALQAILIAKRLGPSATALEEAGATGYFGALTRTALAEYQAASGIAPAAGYFGPLTRAHLSAR